MDTQLRVDDHLQAAEKEQQLIHSLLGPPCHLMTKPSKKIAFESTNIYTMI